MSLKSSKKIETNTYELEVSVSGEDFTAAIMRVYNKKKNSILVPGFRKGKAPKHVIETMYGKGVFYDDALESIFPQVVDEAIKEAGIIAVDNPHDVNISEIGEDGVEMTMKITVKPEIEVKQYKGLEAAKRTVSVSEEEVNEQITRMRERNATITEITDRPAQMGDIAAIDYDGFVDDVPFEGGKGTHDLELGSDTFIPGFEEQVAGHEIGETFDVNVTFPEDYHAEELSGKDAVFHCKLNGLKQKALPELDDEFAKDVSDDAETLDDLKKNIEADLLKDKQGHADADFEQELLVKLAEQVEGEIPECMFEKKAEENKQNFSRRIGQQGIKLEMYLMYMGIEMSQFESDMYEQAVQQVKVRLALEKIAALENIEATDEDLEAEFAKLAETYGVSVDAVKGFFDADSIRSDILCEKAINVVKDAAVITEPADDDAKDDADDAE